VIAAFALLGLGRDPGCGGGDNPPSGANGPCTRAKDCESGLVCREGVCASSSDGADAGGQELDSGDGSADASGDR
jgi:hypothetical protein